MVTPPQFPPTYLWIQHRLPMDIIPDDVLTDIFILAAASSPLRDFDDFVLDRNAELVEKPPSFRTPMMSLGSAHVNVQIPPRGKRDEPRLDSPILFNADLDQVVFGLDAGLAQPSEGLQLRAWYHKEGNCSVSISHVCSRWRDLALQTGELWAQLHFEWPNPAPLSQQRDFLGRSKNCLLDVTIVDPTWRHHMKDLESIMAHSLHRITALRVRAHSDSLATYLEAILPYCVSSLTDLDIISKSPGSEIAVDFGVLSPFRNLTALLLKGVPFKFFPSNPSSLLGNLSILKLRNVETHVSYESFIAAITASRRLETLYLHSAASSQPPRWRSNSHNITLPSLHRLSVECSSPSFIVTLIEHVRMPKLRALRLHLKMETGAPNGGNSMVRDLMDPSSDRKCYPLSGVEVLFLSGNILCDAELIPDFYKSAVKLQYLHLDLRLLPPDFLDALSTNPSSTPNLEVLSTVANYRSLVPLLQQRNAAGFPLKRILFDQRNRYDMEANEDFLRKNVEYGLYDIRRHVDFCDNSDPYDDMEYETGADFEDWGAMAD